MHSGTFSISALEPTYKEREWPADYWPASPDPQSDQAWEQSIAAVRADRESLQELARDARIDLMSVTPHGTNQTYLRELLLVMDHTAYHLGQLVVLRKLLEAQKPN